MIERNGNVFDTDAKYIGHGVNTEGLMGAGIARQIREKFPNNYQVYYDACKRGELAPGDYIAHAEGDLVILNMATQDQPGANARYEWVFSCFYAAAKALARILRVAPERGNKIAIPEIGCGIGGLEWAGVKKIIETVEFLVPEIEWEVWHYQQ